MNNLHKFDNNIESWWRNSKINFLLGVKYWSCTKFSEKLKKKVILMCLNLNTVVMIAFSEMKIPENHTMTKRGLCAKVV